ncbi:progranulin-like [Ixodes scapularis]|uniref:progranulin-like n=1 Tax=Ixodes scapularis TaxID=6945 RepID=UPI001A9F83A1|nr:progranulin-like [Ixodes scapularis]
MCPDGGICPVGQTCGDVGDGRYACCPYSNAVPCGDKLHCCPQGHLCHLSTGTCVGDLGTLAMVRYQHATEAPSGNANCDEPSTVMCHNHQYCERGTKCCRTNESFESYYCCQYPNGTCCSSGTFCCDAGYVCDFKYTICRIKDSYTPHVRGLSELQKDPTILKSLGMPAKSNRAKTIKFENCPDGTSCHYGSSCCQNEDGRNACCPYERAQCCDNERCCPWGFKCNDAEKTCTKDGTVKPMAAKYRSFRNPVPNIDSSPSVPCPTWMICGSNSCCVNQYGAYRCSSYTNGTCCSDGESGCPPGMVCV